MAASNVDLGQLQPAGARSSQGTRAALESLVATVLLDNFEKLNFGVSMGVKLLSRLSIVYIGVTLLVQENSGRSRAQLPVRQVRCGYQDQWNRIIFLLNQADVREVEILLRHPVFLFDQLCISSRVELSALLIRVSS